MPRRACVQTMHSARLLLRFRATTAKWGGVCKQLCLRMRSEDWMATLDFGDFSNKPVGATLRTIVPSRSFELGTACLHAIID